MCLAWLTRHSVHNWFLLVLVKELAALSDVCAWLNEGCDLLRAAEKILLIVLSTDDVSHGALFLLSKQLRTSRSHPVLDDLIWLLHCEEVNIFVTLADGTSRADEWVVSNMSVHSWVASSMIAALGPSVRAKCLRKGLVGALAPWQVGLLEGGVRWLAVSWHQHAFLKLAEWVIWILQFAQDVCRLFDWQLLALAISFGLILPVFVDQVRHLLVASFRDVSRLETFRVFRFFFVGLVFNKKFWMPLLLLLADESSVNCAVLTSRSCLSHSGLLHNF